MGPKDVDFRFLGVIEERLHDVEQEPEPARHVENEHLVRPLRVVRGGHVYNAFDDRHHLMKRFKKKEERDRFEKRG